MNIKILFLVCVFIRVIIAYIVYLYPMRLFAIPLIFIGLGFGYQIAFEPRKRGAFGQSIWWGFLRPFHAFSYITASILLYSKSNLASYVLVVDVIIGSLFHLYYRYDLFNQ